MNKKILRKILLTVSGKIATMIAGALP